MHTNRVYKFYTFNDRNLEGLNQSKVWFSNKEQLNDPFEFSVNYHFPLDLADRERRYLEYAVYVLTTKYSEDKARVIVNNNFSINKFSFLDMIEKEMISPCIESHKKDLNRLNVFSTSIDSSFNAIKHIKNILMWAHYGDGFRGYCLEFSSINFYASLKELNPPDSILMHTPVRYVDSPISIDAIECAMVDESKYFEPLYLKHKSWEYENELRYISQHHGLHSYAPDALKRIYIGEKMPELHRSQLIHSIHNRYPHVELIEIKREKSVYDVYECPIKI